MAGVEDRLNGSAGARWIEGARETLRYALAPLAVGFGLCALLPLAMALARMATPGSLGPHGIGGVFALLAAANLVQRALWLLTGVLFVLAGAQIGRDPYSGGVSLLAASLVVGSATWSTFLRSVATAALAPGLFLTAVPFALVIGSLGLWLLLLLAPRS